MAGLDDLTRFLADDATIDSIASSVGASPDDTRRAISAVVPTLLGGLAVEADSPDGLSSLTNALEQDHDGSNLDQLDDLLSGAGTGKAFDGSGIVDHVFGAEEPEVVQTLAKASGSDPSLLRKLLPVLAPIVMSWLAKKLTGGVGGSAGGSAGGARSGGAAGSGGLTDILGSVLGQVVGDGQLAGGSSGGGSGSSMVDILTGVLGGLAGGSGGESATSGSGGGGGGLGDLIGAVLGGR